MNNQMRVVIEIGPKGKMAVAVAPDWPGLSRGAKTEAAALECLRAYIPRYQPVAQLAGMEAEFSANTDLRVIETYQGTGSTDFWGISFAFSGIDQEPLTETALERELGLLQACWVFFDSVRSRVSAEMQRGPRGGGRDRDRIVRHTFAAELDWAKKLDIRTPLEELLADEGLARHREAYCSAIRTLHTQDRLARAWPLRYLIRHTAFHALDHAWEMEDKDLTASQA